MGLYDPSEPLQNQSVPNALALNVSTAGTTNGATLDNPVGRGIALYIDITTITGSSPTLTVNLQVLDPASGNWVTVASSAALNMDGESTLTLYPGIAVTSNVAVNGAFGRAWRVQAVAGGTVTSIVATVGATLLL